MTRQLNVATLDGAAEFYAPEYLRPTRWSNKPFPKKGWAGIGVFDRVALGGRDFVLQCLINATFKDEHEYLIKEMKGWMGKKALVRFEKDVKELFPPRSDKAFKDALKEHLAIDPDGNHIKGAVGIVQVGVRPIDRRMFEVETTSSILRRIEQGLPLHVPGREDRETHFKESLYTWPVYAGEAEEREAGRLKKTAGAAEPGADPLPDGAFATTPDGKRPSAAGANVTNISAELCIAMLDRVTLSLDEGSTAAEIRGRDGAQPADPDDTEVGTLGFTLTCSDPSVLAAVDDTDGTCSAAFDSISDDVSADATITLTYCRFAATGAGADDHVDGNATTDGSGATDWNTLSIVSGSTVSMTSASVGKSQGSTAT